MGGGSGLLKHGANMCRLSGILLGILVVVPFELSFLELNPRIRRDLLRFDLFVDAMFVVDIFLK